MKIFISWSGDRSRAAAELLNNWVRCVLQAARPWISTQGIDRGSLWFNEIQVQLQDATVGIVCLTQDNKDKPWILFESGALAKGLSASRVCTFLVDLQPSDVENPLAQFNHTIPEQGSMWHLVQTLNRCLPTDQVLSESVLEKVFDTYWPQFHSEFTGLIEETPMSQPVRRRDEKDMLSEILELTRSLPGRVSAIEQSVAMRSSATMQDIAGNRYIVSPEEFKIASKREYAEAERMVREKEERAFSEALSRRRFNRPPSPKPQSGE